MDMSASELHLEHDLANLLNDLAAIQDELLDVLTEKRNHLMTGDLAAIAQLQSREQELCDRLQTCHDQRNSLLALAAKQGFPDESIGKLSKVLSVAHRAKLQKQTKETSARMRLLQHHSLANWVLAQRSLLHVSQLLEIVATGGQIQPTYGTGLSVHLRGALVDREV